jgi:hypothetical protein
VAIRDTSFLLVILLAACDGGSSGSTAGGGSASVTASSSTASSSGGAGAGGATTGSGGAGLGGATGACTTCAGACVDTRNDAQNCGACGHVCPASQHCDHGVCGAPACLVQGLVCPLDHLCCGDACCPAWKMCCNVPGSDAPTCVSIDAGACPTTCAGCL